MAAALRIHAPFAIATGAVFIAVDSIVISLRLWTRKLRGLPLGPDDWASVAACLFTIGLSVGFIVETALGHLGHPASAPSNSNAVNAGFAFYPLQIIQIPALGLIKISILLFYQRIFVRGSSPKFYSCCWVLIGLCTIWAIGFTFAWIFVCGAHPGFYWHSLAVRKRVCTDTNALTDATAISDFLLDLVIILLPLPMIWRLHLSFGRKIGLTAIFFLGALTVTASCVRMVVFIEAEQVNYSQSTDYEFLDTDGLYWSVVEAGVGICAACLPTLYYLVTKDGLRSAVESARSAISLRSIFSRGSNESPDSRRNRRLERPYHGDQVPLTNIARSNVAGVGAVVETKAVAEELSAHHDEALQRTNGIHVAQTLTQTSQRTKEVDETNSY